MAKEDLGPSAADTRHADQPEQEVLLPCSLIDEGFNYRRRFNAAKMTSLRADIRAQGLIYPVIVRQLPNGRYQLLVGNRRFKAVVAEFGPEVSIKAKVRQVTDAEAMALMMSENGERDDPSVIEDAEGAARMLGMCNGDRDEAAALACKACADFGACVSAVPDSLGKTYTDICFNKTCHDTKVQAFADEQNAAAAAAATPTPAGEQGAHAQADDSGATDSGSDDDDSDEPTDAGTSKPERNKVKPNAIRPVITEYREGAWRAVFQRAALKLPIMQSRALLVGLIVHRSSYLSGTEALERIKKATGADLPTFSSGGTHKLLKGLLEFDQNKLALAFQHLPAFVSKDMPIQDLVGFLKALDVKIEQFWKVNETFFDMLTKSELDAVCQEIGLAKAAGKTYASLKNGSKKDFVAAMLKVQGFTYEGAIPKMMRWTSGV